MNKKNKTLPTIISTPAVVLGVVLGVTLLASHAQAQVHITSTQNFTGYNGSFAIDFTAIGNAGNKADKTGYGAVNYNYSIGTYDISQAQINAAGIPGVSAGSWKGSQPAANMTWYQAAAFVNFLNTNQGYQPAYELNSNDTSVSTWGSGIGMTNDAYRNAGAKYFLPTEDEWYKAAYGKSDGSGYNSFPTASSTAPTPVASGTNAGTAVYSQPHGQGPAAVNQAGGGSSYGTMGQGGNVFQWTESTYSGGAIDSNSLSNYPVIRGGGWTSPTNSLRFSDRNGFHPDYGYENVGFRVAEIDPVPEPSSYALFGIGALALVVMARRKSA